MWKPSNKTKWAIMYANDIKIPVGSPDSKTCMENFNSYLGLVWFVLRNKKVREAVIAGRARMFEITD